MAQFKIRRMALKNQFMLLIMTIFIPILAILISSAYHESQKILREADENAQRLISDFIGEQEEIISQTRQFLKLLSRVPSIANLDFEEGNKFLQDIHKYYPQYSTIVAATPEGLIDICAIPLEKTINVQDRSWFQRLTASGEFVIDQFLISRSSLKASLPFAYPVFDDEGRLKAALGAAFDLEYYDTLFEKTNLPAHSEFYVTDRDAHILYYSKQEQNEANSDQKAEYAGKELSQITGFELPDGRKGFLSFQNPSGSEMMYWYERLSVGDETNEICLIIGISRKVLLADANLTNNRKFFLVFLVAFASLILGRIFGNRFIFNPIQSLQKKMIRVQEGDLSLQASLRELPGELRTLSDAFDLMTMKLSERETERDLAEARLRVLFEKASDAIFVSDGEGKLTQVNHRACENTGYSQTELLTMHVYDLDENHNTKESFQEYMKTLSPDKPGILESSHIRKDGSVFPVELTIVRLNTREGLRFMGSVRDITERNNAIREIADLSKFPSEDPNPVLRINREGSLLYINDSGSRVLNNLLQRNRTIVGTKLEEGFLKTKKYGIQSNYELKIGENWFLMIFTPIVDADYINVYGTDITETKRLLAEVNHAEKLRSIGQLAGGIAHDFNNQLAGIFGFIDLLRTKLKESPDELGMVEQISEISHQAKTLTSQLLSFSRKGKTVHKTLDINSLIKGVLFILERSVDKKIKIEFHPEFFQETIAGDPSQLNNVLLNIALNARDAMPEGGNLKLVSRIDILDKESMVRKGLHCEPGKYIEVSITDTGHGMNSEVLNQALDPFFTTKPEGAGTGMGLSAAYGAMKAHGGELKIQSESHCGTTVFLYFPALDKSVEPIINENSETAPVAGSGLVMLVDDNEAICRTGQALLSFLGFDVQSFINPLEAVEFFEVNHRSISFVILDMIMPGMNGSELFKVLKETDSQVRVLLSSGYSLEGEAQNLLNQGVRGFLQKPFTIKQLSGEIEKLINL